MRIAPAAKIAALSLIIGFSAVSGTARAQDVCAEAQAAWSRVQTYQCTYRAITRYGGKQSETIMRYSYQKPDKIRMDIQSPKKGALVIYNAEISDKVRVRPFPSLSALVMTYDLTHKRVTSDSGRTIKDSHLGERVDQLCEAVSKGTNVEIHAEKPVKEIIDRVSHDGKSNTRSFKVGEDGLIRRIETKDGEGNITSLLEWNDLKVNPELPDSLFTELKAR